VPPDAIDRDFTLPYQASKQVAAAGSASTTTPSRNGICTKLAERLVDLDYKFQLWRFATSKRLKRIIGYKRGTGGTGGVSYFDQSAGAQVLPQLWTIRTSM